MRKQLFSALLFTLFIALNVTAQHTISTDLMKKMQKIYDYAQEGYEQRKTVPLLKAAEILIYNPEIQQVKEIGKPDSTKADQEMGHYSYFDPLQLLKDASEYRPVDAKILKWRIKRLEKKLKLWSIANSNASPSGSDIQVKNYLIYSNNSKTIDTNFEKNKTITLSVRVGNDLRLSVWDKNKNSKVGKSEFIGDARLISFKTTDQGIYQIKIENIATKANDCLLMIETR